MEQTDAARASHAQRARPSRPSCMKRRTSLTDVTPVLVEKYRAELAPPPGRHRRAPRAPPAAVEGLWQLPFGVSRSDTPHAGRNLIMLLKIGVASPAKDQDELEIVARFDIQTRDTFVTKSLLAQIPYELPQGSRSLPVASYGHHQFRVLAPTVDLCLRHGQTRFVQTAIVVETPLQHGDRHVYYPVGHPLEGHYDAIAEDSGLCLGIDAIEKILGAVPEQPRYASTRDLVASEPPARDPATLRLSLYPVGEETVAARDVELFLESTRHLHNLFVLLDDQSGMKPASDWQAEDAVKRDVGLTPEEILRVVRVDHGSIILTLKSSVLGALRKLALLFRRYTEVVDGQAMKALAEARKAGVEADVREATAREAIERAKTEEQAAAAENRRKSYEQYRQGILASASALDELLARVEDHSTREKMRQLKDQALLQLAERLILPIASAFDELPARPSSPIALPSREVDE